MNSSEKRCDVHLKGKQALLRLLASAAEAFSSTPRPCHPLLGLFCYLSGVVYLGLGIARPHQAVI